MPRIFVSQQRMQQWTEDGRVSVDNNIMTLPTLGRSFRLTEALHVRRVVTEGGDVHNLVGRVKTEAQLAKLGAEAYHDSLIVGDTAYECEAGFVGEVIGAAQPTATSGLHRLEE